MNHAKPHSHGLTRALLAALLLLGLLLAPGAPARAVNATINLSDYATTQIMVAQTAIDDALAAASTGDVVTVINTFSNGSNVGGSSLSLYIPGGVTLEWQAQISGNGSQVIEVSGDGLFLVSGTARVTASGNNGIAIQAAGDVQVQGGTVEASGVSGTAIYAAGDVQVQGGTVEASGDNGTAIWATGSGSMVTVSGTAQVIAGGNDGIAISAAGDVQVQGGTVEASGNFGYAISASGNVQVQGGTVEASGDSGRAIQAAGDVQVQSGTVEASGVSGTAIRAAGDVQVQSGTVEASGTTGGRAIWATGSGSTVTVSGTARVTASRDEGIAIYAAGDVQVQGGTVEASGNNGRAIWATGSGSTVTVSGTARVTASRDGGIAIYAAGDVQVQSGTVEAGGGSGVAIDAAGDVQVQGGTVEAGGQSGYAIWTAGSGSTVSVSGTARVTASGNNGIAIQAAGDVQVQGGTVEASGDSGRAIWATGSGSTVTVSGTAQVTASGNNGIAIQAAGDVQVQGGTVEASGDYGPAIYAAGDVEVQGGTVEASGNGGTAIWATGSGSTVTVSGTARVTASRDGGIAIYAAGDVQVQSGTVEAGGNDGYAIQATGSGSTVTVSGTAQVIASGYSGRAIRAMGGGSTVTVSGGVSLILSDDTAIDASSINLSGSPAFLYIASGTDRAMNTAPTVSALHGFCYPASYTDGKIFAVVGAPTLSVSGTTLTCSNLVDAALLPSGSSVGFTLSVDGQESALSLGSTGGSATLDLANRLSAPGSYQVSVRQTVTVNGVPYAGAAGNTVTVTLADNNGGDNGSGNSGGGSSDSYPVRFDLNGGGAALTRYALRGGTLTAPAEPTRAGYEFTGWYTDAACTNLYNFSQSVTGSFTLYAGWQALEPQTPATHAAYINGYPDGTFRPEASLTRAEAAALIYRLLGSPDTGGTASFTDVAAGDWHHAAVTALTARGLLTGYADGSFKPQATITRAEFVTLALRYAGLPESTDSVDFADVTAEHWAVGALAAAAEAGWLRESSGDTFRPEDPVTRAEAVTILNRVLGCAGVISGTGYSDVPADYWAYADILAASTEHGH